MRIRDRYAALLLDLDGTLIRGQHAIDGASAALADSEQQVVFVTNNASRSPEKIATQLVDHGFTATPDDIVTSAQAAARLLAQQVPKGASVLVVGTDDLAAEVSAVGLQPVRRASENTPAAVVQGHSPHTAWADLAEAAYAVRAGAHWVAANTDKTLPNERGLAPGNGAMVAAVRTATDAEPLIAGKPYAPLLQDALLRAHTTAALVIGDRLDTDIAGARRVGLDSLLVLTGVSTLAELATWPEHEWPTYVAHTLAAMNQPPLPWESVPAEEVGISADLAEKLRQSPGRAVLLRTPTSQIR